MVVVVIVVVVMVVVVIVVVVMVVVVIVLVVMVVVVMVVLLMVEDELKWSELKAPKALFAAPLELPLMITKKTCQKLHYAYD